MEGPKYSRSDLQQAAWKLMERDQFRLETMSYREQKTRYVYNLKVRFWKPPQDLDPFGTVMLEGTIDWFYKLDAPEEDRIWATLYMNLGETDLVWEASYSEDGEWSKWQWTGEA